VLVVGELLRDSDEPETALRNAVERLRAVYGGQPAFASVLEQLLAHRLKVKTPGGGWVFDSFWSAWQAFAQSASYRETIERAVRLGHDTDTTAAIAGGLAGVRWGLDERAAGIPFKWQSALRGRDIVEALIAKFEAVE
jgi:ADP-ribosyl-[dinitrogen reductase] hydrolase